MITVNITPKFDSKIIYHDWIEKDWFNFQNQLFEAGNTMLSYMQQYITSKIKGESSGNLVRSIKFYGVAGSGTGMISWGIGLIPEMDALAPYWHIIDVGGSSFQGDYHFVPGRFHGTNKFTYMPGNSDGDGYMLPSGVKGVIKPMHFSDATRLELDREIQRIIQSLKSGTKSFSSGRAHGWGRGAGGAR